MSNGMRPVHPGEILAEELDELGLSANAMAKDLGVPANRISAILKGQRGVTADTALRLSRYFGTTPQFWLNLQKTLSCGRRRSSQDRRLQNGSDRERRRWQHILRGRPQTQVRLALVRTPMGEVQCQGSSCAFLREMPVH